MASHYLERLAGVEGLRIPREGTHARTNWQTFIVEVSRPFRQREVMRAMLDAGISTRRAVICAHRELSDPHSEWSCGRDPKECGCIPGHCERLTQSESAQEHAIILPLYQQMTDADQERVAAALRAAVS